MNNPIISRKVVASKNNYLSYKEDLRKDFLYSCAYCTITECEIGDMQIDHFRPQISFSVNEKHLMNEYENLYLSCSECNLKKSDYFPNDCYSVNDPRIKDNRVIQIDREDPSIHLKLNGDRIKGISITGIFNENLLLLNRLALTKMRRARVEAKRTEEEIAFGVSCLRKLRIDSLPQDLRLKAASIKHALMAEAQAIEKLIEHEAKNELLDPDPDKAGKLEKRRAMLEKEGAIPQVYRKNRKKR